MGPNPGKSHQKAMNQTGERFQGLALGQLFKNFFVNNTKESLMQTIANVHYKTVLRYQGNQTEFILLFNP